MQFLDQSARVLAAHSTGLVATPIDPNPARCPCRAREVRMRDRIWPSRGLNARVRAALVREGLLRIGRGRIEIIGR